MDVESVAAHARCPTVRDAEREHFGRVFRWEIVKEAANAGEDGGDV